MANTESKGDDQRHLEIWQELKSSTIDDLHAQLQSSEEMRRYTAAQELHIRGERTTFEFAQNLLRSADSTHREIAAFTLGQLGTPDSPFRIESIPLLVDRLHFDDVPSVRAAAAGAIGHLQADVAVDALCIAARDVDSKVRSNVAFALGRTGHETIVPTLLTLTDDQDSSVVSWAVLALRTLNINLKRVRDRFVELLQDENVEVVDEAICGLAQWRDKRALPLLTERLAQNEINLDLLYAARDLEDVTVLPRLVELQQEWGNEAPQCLHDAILVLSSHL